jgi:hypothetical protein
MIFLPELAEKIVRGEKTQTRRIAKWNEFISVIGGYDTIGCPLDVCIRTHSRGLKWVACPSVTYAVQPGRGKKAIARITITAIRQERLQSIPPSGIEAEGFGAICVENLQTATEWFIGLWDRIHRKGEQWADDPDVWVLTFKMVPT